jgi:hypothetical protein
MKKVSVGCILAVVVVIIGVIVTYKIVRLCQRLFPDTPPPDANITNVTHSAWIMDSGGSRAAVSPSAGSLLAPAESDCALSFSCFIHNDQLCLTNCALPHMVAGNVFGAELLDLGLEPDRTSYGLDTSISDISYVAGVLRVGDGVTMVLEQSFNMVDWWPVMTNSFSVGQTLNITLPVQCDGNSFFRGVTP